MNTFSINETDTFSPGERLPVEDAAELFFTSLMDAMDEVPTVPEYLSAGLEEGYVEWADPRPIVGELLPVATLSPAMLPKTLANVVFDEADRMPAPPDYFAATLIVAIGSVIGARCAIKPKRQDDGWLIVPNLWGGVVGEPSTKKTPAMAVALANLDRLEADEAVKVEGLMGSYNAEKAAFNAFKKTIDQEMRAGAKETDQAERERRLSAAKRSMAELEEPEEPQARRFKVNDATVEKIGDLLTTNAAGLLVVRDELTGLLASWDKQGHETDRAFFLEAWNGQRGFNIDRIGRGSQFVPHLCLSVFGSIQPELLSQYLGTLVHSLGNDGLFQRFQVLVFPDSVLWSWQDRPHNEQARRILRTVFEHLATFDPVQDGAAQAGAQAAIPYFCFCADAQHLFIQWSEELYRRIDNEPNLWMRQHLAKYEKLVCSLALIFHLVEGKVGQISEDALLQAAAYCAYLETHARRIYGLVDTTKVAAAQMLSRRLAEGKLNDGFSTRDVLRKGWTGLKQSNQVEAALAALEESGWVKAVQPRQGEVGRPTISYRINPKLLTARGNDIHD